MKTAFISLFTLLISLSAQAQIVVVLHDYDTVTGVGAESIPLKSSCITDTELKSTVPVRVCTSLTPIAHPARGEEAAYTEWVCEKNETQFLASARAFKRTVCEKYADSIESQGSVCLKYSEVDDFMPATIKLMTITNPYSERKAKIVYSTHTFPTCATK